MRLRGGDNTTAKGDLFRLCTARGVAGGSRATLNVGNEGGKLIPASDKLRAILISGHRKRILFGGGGGEVPGEPCEALDGAVATTRSAVGSHRFAVKGNSIHELGRL